jgi:hypothetical protein
VKKIISSFVIAPFVVITFYWILDKYTHFLFDVKTIDGEAGISFINFIFTLLFAVGIGITLFEKGYFDTKKK